VGEACDAFARLRTSLQDGAQFWQQLRSNAADELQIAQDFCAARSIEMHEALLRFQAGETSRLARAYAAGPGPGPGPGGLGAPVPAASAPRAPSTAWACGVSGHQKSAGDAA
jgi:hypothetical protein